MKLASWASLSMAAVEEENTDVDADADADVGVDAADAADAAPEFRGRCWTWRVEAALLSTSSAEMNGNGGRVMTDSRAEDGLRVTTSESESKYSSDRGIVIAHSKGLNRSSCGWGRGLLLCLLLLSDTKEARML